MSQWRAKPDETDLKDFQYFWIKPNKEEWIEGFSSAQIVSVYKGNDRYDHVLCGKYVVNGINWGSPSAFSCADHVLCGKYVVNGINWGSPSAFSCAFKNHLWCGPVPLPEDGDA